jgi:hypothetical protein
MDELIKYVFKYVLISDAPQNEEDTTDDSQPV